MRQLQGHLGQKAVGQYETPQTCPRKISIELKSGKSVDLFQLERYLFASDLVMAVRVSTRDVAVVDQKEVQNVLIDSMGLLTDAAKEIVYAEENKLELPTVQGDWCYDCAATCKYRKSGRKKNASGATLAEHEKFMQDVDVAVQKTVELLADLIR